MHNSWWSFLYDQVAELAAQLSWRASWFDLLSVFVQRGSLPHCMLSSTRDMSSSYPKRQHPTVLKGDPYHSELLQKRHPSHWPNGLKTIPFHCVCSVVNDFRNGFKWNSLAECLLDYDSCQVNWSRFVTNYWSKWSQYKTYGSEQMYEPRMTNVHSVSKLS